MSNLRQFGLAELGRLQLGLMAGNYGNNRLDESGRNPNGWVIPMAHDNPTRSNVLYADGHVSTCVRNDRTDTLIRTGQPGWWGPGVGRIEPGLFLDADTREINRAFLGQEAFVVGHARDFCRNTAPISPCCGVIGDLEPVQRAIFFRRYGSCVEQAKAV